MSHGASEHIHPRCRGSSLPRFFQLDSSSREGKGERRKHKESTLRSLVPRWDGERGGERGKDNARSLSRGKVRNVRFPHENNRAAGRGGGVPKRRGLVVFVFVSRGGIPLLPKMRGAGARERERLFEGEQEARISLEFRDVSHHVSMYVT